MTINFYDVLNDKNLKDIFCSYQPRVESLKCCHVKPKEKGIIGDETEMRLLGEMDIKTENSLAKSFKDICFKSSLIFYDLCNII